MNDCLFCNIILGSIPSEKIFEDDVVCAFLDIHPVGKGHLLVVPKLHAENMFEQSEDSYAELMRRVHMLAPHVRAVTGADGINIGMNNGKAAGQLIFHAHIHIIPRFLGDGHKHWSAIEYKEGEQALIANKMRNAISA